MSAVLDCRDEAFAAQVRSLDTDIRRIVQIRETEIKGLDLAPNAASCGKYGGCYYQDRCRLDGGDLLASYVERDRTLK